MKVRGQNLTVLKITCLVLYYCILRYLPSGPTPIIGKFFRYLRYQCCKHIFLKCGKNANVERMAFFASGLNIELGENSSIGINSTVPGSIKIGKNVMMGPNCYIFNSNHGFDRIDIPIIEQGHTERKQCIIEDDVWIGRNVIFTPGRTVKVGSIIAAGTVLCKDFDSYSVVGGNPSQLIRNRKLKS
jgi:maltose O-acetyltransferase